jgi:teichuronic acid biosynthesis glycosyltransferase TuaG
MASPIVSIITPSYNSSSFVRDCYKSIVSQTIEDWEWVVTDDASLDGTAEIIREISDEDPRVKPAFFTENRGAARSRNLSIDRAKGAVVAFLDIDDYWRHDKLETQLLAHRGGHSFTFTSFIQFRSSPEEDGKVIDPGPAQCFDYNDMLHKRATLGCSTVMLDRAAIGKKRMPDLRSGQDYAFWLSIMKDNVSAYLVPEPMTYYRVLPNSLSRNKFKKARRQWQIYRDLEQLSLLQSAWVFKSYAIHALMR